MRIVRPIVSPGGYRTKPFAKMPAIDPLRLSADDRFLVAKLK